jgi:hypothetical protein
VRERLDGDDEIGPVGRDRRQVVIEGSEVEAARVRDAAPYGRLLRALALTRAQRQPVVTPAEPLVQIEGSPAQSAPRIDDARLDETWKGCDQPLVDDVVGRNVRPVGREPPVDREGRVAAAADQPREPLEAAEPVVIASEPAQRPRLSPRRSTG